MGILLVGLNIVCHLTLYLAMIDKYDGGREAQPVDEEEDVWYKQQEKPDRRKDSKWPTLTSQEACEQRLVEVDCQEMADLDLHPVLNEWTNASGTAEVVCMSAPL